LIIFGNFYTKSTGLRFNIIALYDSGHLIEINDAMKNELFPNDGKIYVPTNYSAPDFKYGLYEIYESYTYDPDNPKSLKYAIGSEVKDVPLYEVIQIEETLDSDHLQRRFQNGFHLPYEPLANVLVHTADDWMIGPLQLKKRSGGDAWEVPDANFAPYRQNHMEFLRYENRLAKEPERFFVVSDIARQPETGLIDIADDERAVRDILKILRDNADFGELSRKVIRQLGEWGDSGYPGESHLQQRLKRAIRVLETHTLDESLLKDVQKTIFELPHIQAYVKNKLETFQLELKEKFEEEHRSLLNQIRELKNQAERSKREVDARKKEQKRLEQTIQQLQAKSVEKVAEIRSNVVDVFVNQLLLSGLAYPEISAASSMTAGTDRPVPSESSMFSMVQRSGLPPYDTLDEFKRVLDSQLQVPELRLLFQTVLCAINAGLPIAVTGKRAMELAQWIARTVAANETLTVLPEVHTFSLNRLADTFNHYQNEREVKALILHNAHLTTAEFSILPFLGLKRWAGNLRFPDLAILSLDETETSADFLGRLYQIPVLDADSLFKKMTSRKIDPYGITGQLPLTALSAIGEAWVAKDADLKKTFVEWLLDKHDLDLDPWPRHLDGWLNGLNVDDVDETKLFEWVWTMFKHGLRPEAQGSDTM
jgi:hypothetical protein